MNYSTHIDGNYYTRCFLQDLLFSLGIKSAERMTPYANNYFIATFHPFGTGFRDLSNWRLP